MNSSFYVVYVHAHRVPGEAARSRLVDFNPSYLYTYMELPRAARGIRYLLPSGTRARGQDMACTDRPLTLRVGSPDLDTDIQPNATPAHRGMYVQYGHRRPKIRAFAQRLRARSYSLQRKPGGENQLCIVSYVPAMRDSPAMVGI